MIREILIEIINSNKSIITEKIKNIMSKELKGVEKNIQVKFTSIENCTLYIDIENNELIVPYDFLLEKENFDYLLIHECGHYNFSKHGGIDIFNESLPKALSIELSNITPDNDTKKFINSIITDPSTKYFINIFEDIYVNNMLSINHPQIKKNLYPEGGLEFVKYINTNWHFLKKLGHYIYGSWIQGQFILPNDSSEESKIKIILIKHKEDLKKIFDSNDPVKIYSTIPPIYASVIKIMLEADK